MRKYPKNKTRRFGNSQLGKESGIEYARKA